jgi:hypothetical protein
VGWTLAHEPAQTAVVLFNPVLRRACACVNSKGTDSGIYPAPRMQTYHPHLFLSRGDDSASLQRVTTAVPQCINALEMWQADTFDPGCHVDSILVLQTGGGRLAVPRFAEHSDAQDSGVAP